MRKNVYIIYLMVLLWFPLSIFGQITTAIIEGIVSEETTQETLPGATLIAIHQPTGTQYGIATQNDGSYVLANLKTGGPYTLTAAFIGFEENKKEGIYVTLGETTQIDFALKEASLELEAIEVTSNKNDLFNGDKSGVSTNIGEEQINKIPVLNRSLQEVTRLTPQGFQNTFAGSSYRYNNLNIDGASNNDVLGFQEPASGAGGSVASNTPGALAGTQPISLEAIEAVQVSIAPYDVRQGNFTGANINAVTRSGTNQLHGAVYSFGRNQLLTGKSIDEARESIADYYDLQSGFRIGGPILKNKLFFFANYEATRRSEPVLNAPGDEGTNISYDVANALADTLQSRYDYDIGAFGEVNNERISNKLFFRLDYNLGKKHQLTLRDNFVQAYADNLERGVNVLRYGTQGYRHNSTNNSLVGELRSIFNNNVSNHLIVGYNKVEDNRTYDGNVFPHVEIVHNTANTILFGSYREASIYGLSLNTFQLTDQLNIYKNRHTFTIGTNNDFYNIEYRFLTAWNGRWEYNSLEDFYNNQPSRIRGVYNYENNDFEFNRDNPSAAFRVMLLSAYIQDKYRVSNKLTLTAGLRFDMQVHPDKVPVNSIIVNTPEFEGFNNDFGGVPQINPRIAFNYLVNDKVQLRGGSGLFTGRIPFAWYAYAHYISGLSYGNIDLRPTEPIEITDNLAELQDLQPGLTEINLVDNDFKLPRVWRSSLALDVKLPKDLLFTIEGMYTKSISDILFQSLNLKDSTMRFDGADDRFYYLGSSSEKKINPTFTNVFLLTNTDQGYKYHLTASLQKNFKNANITAAYTFGESKDLSNGVRNSMAANFNVNQAIDSNNPELTWSNFDMRHRIVASASYQIAWSKKHQTNISAIYTNRAGSPYSFVYAGDVNKDGSSRNDLIYIPANSDEIKFQDITDSDGDVVISANEQWEQLNNYIEQDDYLKSRRGDYAQRNGARTPWNSQLDIRLAHQWHFNDKEDSHRLEITLDFLNFLNLLHQDWGHQTFVPNVNNASYSLLKLKGVEDNQPVYQFDNPTSKPYQIDPLNSRWQAQLGVRYAF